MSTMRDLSEANAKQLAEKNRQIEAVQSDISSLKSALEKSWVELAEQQKQNAANHSKSNSILQDIESKAKAEVQQLLSKHSKEFADRENSLLQTIQELRSA